MPHPRLQSLAVSGFRSLREFELTFGDMTLLIGPNGAGKSNVISALQLLLQMRTGSLRRWVAQQGGASTVLHYGPEVTSQLAFSARFEDDAGRENRWDIELGYTAGDSFAFLDERVLFRAPGKDRPVEVHLGSGHVEALLSDAANGGGSLNTAELSTVRFVNRLMSRVTWYHFHNTSFESPLRQNSRLVDDQRLRSNGSNLAAYLYRLKGSAERDDQAAWRMFQHLVQRIAPFIKELTPSLVNPDQPERSAVRLFWTDDRDGRFDVHDLSDGTLRAIALFAALTQPPSVRPSFLAFDEPELGLHPAAIALFASVARSVSATTQVLVATQSPMLLDHYAPEEVCVVERADGASTVRRLDASEPLRTSDLTPVC